MQTEKDKLVKLTIDDQEAIVAPGTNILEAARSIGISIPYFCYHPDLSVVANCRICQVEVEGAPKLVPACQGEVREGMVVHTHHTSQSVKDAQAATLEFILINHPLDCTVCDQAGHCKLQDYYYDFSGKASRFLEEKQLKAKAKPLGPTVMLDGERCIACSRCVRFCEEITGTGELGLVNRGDRVEIDVVEGAELKNPLSGTVVDLCPVGALTHRDWRFNSRIWYAKQSASICPGCSTGCNTMVAVRDGEVVQVKARYNREVNKEWMCDEGRYGLPGWLPKERLTEPAISKENVSWQQALDEAAHLKSGKALVLVAPDLLLEDYWIIRKFLDKYLSAATVAIAYGARELNEVEALLMNPDRAANYQGALFTGLVSGDLEQGYNAALNGIKGGEFERLILIGDRSLRAKDLKDEVVVNALTKVKESVALLSDADSALAQAARIVMPVRTYLERSGLMINHTMRLQYTERCADFPDGSEAVWRVFNNLAAVTGEGLVELKTDNGLTRHLLSHDERLSGVILEEIKEEGRVLAL